MTATTTPVPPATAERFPAVDVDIGHARGPFDGLARVVQAPQRVPVLLVLRIQRPIQPVADLDRPDGRIELKAALLGP